jgi:hypothetical protein
MKYLLKLSNNKHIDMTKFVLQQMSGEITKADVQDRINYYKLNDK